MSAPDPFALGGSEDAAILSLFRQWIDGQRAAGLIVDESENGDKVAAANERLDSLTREIDDLPAQGMAGLAIKSYLAIHFDHHAFESGGDSAGLRSLDPKMLGRGVNSIVAMLRDAARFVPEIAPLVPREDETERHAEADLPALRERVAAIVAEFDVPLPEGDAGLAEAERRLHEMSKSSKALYREFEITMEIEAEITLHRDRVEERCHDALTDTEPQTLAGAATILRYLLGVHGKDLLNGADEPIANVVALIDRQGGAP
jgi:hypothetical protein